MHPDRTFKYLSHYDSITMVMETLQIRLPRATVEQIDALVKKGIYSSRSDAIREVTRRLIFWREQAGILPYKGNSVELVRKVREKFTHEELRPEEINKFLKPDSES